jgi:hypothetical protein
MDSQTTPAIEDRQYQEWGVLVFNSNLKSAHIANGLLQVLRALPRLADSPAPWREDGVPEQFTEVVKEALAEVSGGIDWMPSRAAVSLSVTKSKNGPMYLTGQCRPSTKADEATVQAGLEHLREVFAADSPTLTKAQHELLAGALNADGVVRVAGATDPTSPGLGYAGFTSTHTLKPMHAATFLGALTSSGEPGRGVVAALHRIAKSRDDAHSRLMDNLKISSYPVSEEGVEGWPDLSEGKDLSGALPYPRGEEWAAFSEVVVRLVSSLLDWNQGGTSKQETMMSVVDLAGLLLSLKMLGAKNEPSRALLMVCPTGTSTSARYAVEAARRTLRAAQHRLDRRARDEAFMTVTQKGNAWEPSKAVRTLALATGWLFPRNAQGRAKHYLSPGMRQVVSLCQSLIKHGEDLSWGEFQSRALRVGLALGGAEDTRASDSLGIVGAQEALRIAGAINQDYLIQLGLARKESDGVVRVTGGV